MSDAKLREAACACGQLKLRLNGDPQIVSSCHCIACQRRTGSLFGVQAFFKLDQIASIDGERRSFQRIADSGTPVVSQFCPHCGSTVYWERPNLPGMVTVAVGNFGDPKFGPPARTVWTESKHDWLDFPDGMLHYVKAPPG